MLVASWKHWVVLLTDEVIMFGVYSNHIPSGILTLMYRLGREGEAPILELEYIYVQEAVSMGWVTLSPITLRSGMCSLTEFGKRAYCTLHGLANMDERELYTDEGLCYRRAKASNDFNGPGVMVHALLPPHRYDYVVETIDETLEPA
jgi:hypothetical protein